MSSETTTRTGHTPGPWRYEDHGSFSDNTHRIEVFGGPENDPHRVCCIDDNAAWEDPGEDRKRVAHWDLANARLIAAAPELLAHVEDQHRVIDVLLARVIELDPTFRPTQFSGWPVVERTLPLLAKAKGGA